jgi:hypothetical protein
MAHAHDSHHHGDFVEKFTIQPGLRKFIFGLIGVGAFLLVLGVVINIALGEPSAHTEGDPHAAHATEAAGHDAHAADAHTGEAHAGGHHGPSWTGPYWLNRLLTSLVQNGFFFMGISIIMIFFIAVKFTANAGWHVLMMRIPLAFAEFMPVGWLLLMIVVLLEIAGVVHIHAWTDSHRVEGDPLLQSKAWYLNHTFFFIRQLLAGVGWFMAIQAFRKLSVAEETLGGTKTFWSQRKVAAGFLVFFAFTFCAMAFDWMMACDPHWFSTMFGVHMFASCWVSALAMMAILMTYLKKAGYMPQLNESHFHDIGKFVFGFSVFWTYIYFCQFLLIWYANIPEETMYFKRILDNYPFLFALNFVINFIFPFLALMTNTSKRQPLTLSAVAVVIICGHALDMFLATSPSVYGEFGGIGFTEIGAFLLLGGVFLFLGFNSLTKRSLVAKNHPYLEESLHHYY